jgi:hypothetical protein
VRTCWQIREALGDGSTTIASRAVPAARGNGGSHPFDDWQVDCQHCEVYNSKAACWEQCNGCPCCCAPIHVTCDFCILYIEHRREVAGMPQA